MTRLNFSHTQLARRSGVDPSTLSKFLNDPKNIKILMAQTEDKIANAVSNCQDMPNPRLSKNDTMDIQEIAQWRPHNQTDIFNKTITNFCKQQSNTTAWHINSTLLEAVGYMNGDVVIVSERQNPRRNDLVLVQIVDHFGNANTVFRIFNEPYLLTASKIHPVLRPTLIDGDKVTVLGTVIFSMRARLSS